MSQCSTGLIWGSGETLSICADFAEVMELPCGLKLEVCEQAEGSLKAWWRIVNSNCG
jgi:hypothetical protein